MFGPAVTSILPGHPGEELAHQYHRHAAQRPDHVVGRLFGTEEHPGDAADEPSADDHAHHALHRAPPGCRTADAAHPPPPYEPDWNTERNPTVRQGTALCA